MEENKEVILDGYTIPANDRIPFPFTWSEVKKGDRVLNMRIKTTHNKWGEPIKKRHVSVYKVLDINIADPENKKIELESWFAHFCPKAVLAEKDHPGMNSDGHEEDDIWLINRSGRLKTWRFILANADEFDE